MDTSTPTAKLQSGEIAQDQLEHKVQNKYLTAVRDVVGAIPVALPSFGAIDEAPSAAELCERLDGLLFTGAISNVHPTRYGQAPSAAAEPYDPRRDGTTFSLLEHALETGLPIFCICRGFQELNVAHGGSLYPQVHEVEGRMDHRRPTSPFYDVEYGETHEITPTVGGRLDHLLAEANFTDQPRVNSLHLQAVDKLGEGLLVEATAPDGTVEAMRSTKAAGYNFAVQWHPEFNATRVALSRILFEDFAKAL